MNFLNIIRHLLPKSESSKLTNSGDLNNSSDKQLTDFWEGMTGTPEDIKDYTDLIYLDLFPQTTRELDLWEKQFNLPDTGLTEQQRRDRLEGAWQSKGGQDPRYIQDTLQAAGFPVFLHEWWVPGTENPVGTNGCVAPRNPLEFLAQPDGSGAIFTLCDEDVMECGEDEALCGNFSSGEGYALVNKVYTASINEIALCGEDVMECGELEAQCANASGVNIARKEYTIPSDPAKWPYFVYFGAETFPNMAVIPESRREEFEDLCLKICPLHLWIGLLVRYSTNFDYIGDINYQFIGDDNYDFIAN